MFNNKEFCLLYIRLLKFKPTCRIGINWELYERNLNNSREGLQYNLGIYQVYPIYTLGYYRLNDFKKLIEDRVGKD